MISGLIIRTSSKRKEALLPFLATNSSYPPYKEENPKQEKEWRGLEEGVSMKGQGLVDGRGKSEWLGHDQERDKDF